MLAGLKEVLAEGKKKNIAIGSFNTPTLEALIAILGAAEELDLPVIISHAQLHEDVAPLDIIGPIMVEFAKRSKVKVCVHLDHGEDPEYCKRAIALGFTSIMIDYSASSYEENIAGTREMVEYAHAHGVDVEAELGRLPHREGGSFYSDLPTENPEDLYTDPSLVNDYLDRTGVDALAIAFGAVHGMHRTEPKLSTEVITAVRNLTDVPLVMHGGSGISDDDYRKVIACGINKINYYSYMAYEGYACAKATVEAVPADFYHNLAHKATLAMKENVKQTMRVFGGMQR